MLFLFFKSDDFTGTYVLLSESVDKSLAKYARGVKQFFNSWKIIQPLAELANHWGEESFKSWKMIQPLKKVVLNHLGIQPRCIKGFSILGKSSNHCLN